MCVCARWLLYLFFDLFWLCFCFYSFCLNLMPWRHETKGHGQRYPNFCYVFTFPSHTYAHTQTHCNFSFPSWSQGSVDIHKSRQIKTRGIRKDKKDQLSTHHVQILIHLRKDSWPWFQCWFFFSVLNFKNFLITGFILCRRTKTSWSIRIVTVGNVSTSQLVSKVSRPLSLFLPIVAKDVCSDIRTEEQCEEVVSVVNHDYS